MPDYTVTLRLTCASRRSDHRRPVRWTVSAAGFDGDRDEAARFYAARPPAEYAHAAPPGYDVEAVAVASVEDDT